MVGAVDALLEPDADHGGGGVVAGVGVGEFSDLVGAEPCDLFDPFPGPPEDLLLELFVAVGPLLNERLVD